MSTTTTLQQSKGLKELGFNEPVRQYHELFHSYDNFNDINWHIVPRDTKKAILNDYNGREGYEDCFSAPQINDALEWCMKEYGVWGYVTPLPHTNVWSYHTYIKDGEGLWQYKLNFDEFPTFPEAQTACLDAVINECKKIKATN